MRTWEVEDCGVVRTVEYPDHMDLYDVRLEEPSVRGERLRSPLRPGQMEMLKYLAWASDFRRLNSLSEWVDTPTMCAQYAGEAHPRTVIYRLGSLTRRGLLEKREQKHPLPMQWRITRFGRLVARDN